MFFQIRSIKADVFSWLDQVQDGLEKGQKIDEGLNRADETDKQNDDDIAEFGFFDEGRARITIEKMKELIFYHISDFVEMDPVQAVKLCDQWFDKDYNSVARALKDQKDLAYNFLHTVLLQNE